MKKKLLLILPALMVLSACSNVSLQPKVNNAMFEDTLAHEELFGVAEEDVDFGLKKVNPLKIAFDSEFVKIGYQIQFDAHGSGTADDTLSIRFVAAIKDKNVEAYWHRGFAQPNGYEGAETSSSVWRFKLDDGVENQSNTLYATLTDGGTPITAGSGIYTGYQGFVIYTLMGIPYETYKDSYLGAYVELIDPEDGENKKQSDFLAIKVEKKDDYHSINAFAVPFATYNGKHFLQGKINGNENQTLLEDSTTLDSDNNYASYKDIALQSGDYFGSYYLSASHFQLFGHDTFFAESSTYLSESSDLSDYCSPIADGTYSLLVSKGSGKENHVYTVQDAANQTFTINDLPNWLNNDSAVMFVQVERSNHEWYWISISVEGTSTSFTAPGNILTMQFVRCAPGTTTPNWSTKGDAAGRIYNNTENISTSSGVYTYGSSSGTGSWSAHNPS